LLAVLTAVVAAGCRDETPATAAPPTPAGEARQAPRQVRVVPAAESRVARAVSASGTLAADDQVILGLQVAGRVSEIPVDLGDPVRKGQVVARLDPGDFKLRVEQAEAALHQARARLGLRPDGTDDRVDPEQTALVRQARAVLDEARLSRERAARLWEQQFIARAQLDAAVAALQVAEGRYQDAIEEVRTRQAVLAQRRSELALARQQLADAVLYAPLDGRVRERQASVGQYLGVGAPVMTVVRIHPLRLRLLVPEREAAAVRVGHRVRLTVEGDAATYTGRVARLSPAIQEQSRTLLIEAEVPNERGVIRPGAFAKADIVTDVEQRLVTVPASAIVIFAGIEKVITVHDGKTAEKRVQTGRRDGPSVQIVAGLAAGELVVVEPGNLTGGVAVEVVR
jgi:RND family efflux transporter MFP subunit